MLTRRLLLASPRSVHTSSADGATSTQPVAETSHLPVPEAYEKRTPAGVEACQPNRRRAGSADCLARRLASQFDKELPAEGITAEAATVNPATERCDHFALLFLLHDVHF